MALEGYGDVSNSLDPGSSSLVTGYRYAFTAGKVSGRYTAIGRYKVVSDKFNPNDMGYLAMNNIVNYGLEQKFNIYKPFWKLASFYNTFDIDLGNLFTPRHYTFFTFSGKHFLPLENGFLLVSIGWLFQFMHMIILKHAYQVDLFCILKMHSLEDLFLPITEKRLLLMPV